MNAHVSLQDTRAKYGVRENGRHCRCVIYFGAKEIESLCDKSFPRRMFSHDNLSLRSGVEMGRKTCTETLKENNQQPTRLFVMFPSCWFRFVPSQRPLSFSACCVFSLALFSVNTVLSCLTFSCTSSCRFSCGWFGDFFLFLFLFPHFVGVSV